MFPKQINPVSWSMNFAHPPSMIDWYYDQVLEVVAICPSQAFTNYLQNKQQQKTRDIINESPQ